MLSIHQLVTDTLLVESFYSVKYGLSIRVGLVYQSWRLGDSSRVHDQQLVFTLNFPTKFILMVLSPFYYKTGTMGRIGSISYVLPIRQNIDILNRDIRVATASQVMMMLSFSPQKVDSTFFARKMERTKDNERGIKVEF